MKKRLTVLLLLVSSFALAQTSFLKEAVAKLDRALIEKDTVALKQLVHKDLSYGHSNGWVESKADVIKDLFSGKLTYNKIESSQASWKLTSEVATLRTTTDISYGLEGKPGELHLHVLQVWLKNKQGLAIANPAEYETLRIKKVKGSKPVTF